MCSIKFSVKAAYLHQNYCRYVTAENATFVDFVFLLKISHKNTLKLDTHCAKHYIYNIIKFKFLTQLCHLSYPTHVL
jgi:hypothetical protein